MNNGMGNRIQFGSESSKTNILVTVPNGDSWIHKHVMLVCMQIVREETIRGRFKGHIALPTNKPLENNQHIIMRDIVEKGYDFWINIDSDNPPTRNPLDLVLYNKDIISCPTPVWYWDGSKPGDRPIYWTGYDYVPEADGYKEHEPKEGLQRVDAFGGGCFCIAKRVLLHPEMQKGAFARKTYENGIVHKGNDISFSERARACGFEIYNHYDFPCRHFVTGELTEIAQAFQGVIEHVHTS